MVSKIDPHICMSPTNAAVPTATGYSYTVESHKHSQLRHCILFLATHANSDRNVGGAQCKAAVMAVHFGRNMISVSVVFLQTQLSYAFVNRKPIVPGRILQLSLYCHA